MKEWYLTNNYRPVIVSGYETDAMTEFATDNFDDVLETSFSDFVLLYDSTLTDSKKIRCVIQGNSADTQLKSMERIGLFPIGTVKAGMYIYFENRYWLIVGYPSNNKVYEKAVMKMCQYKLKWQNDKGDTIERWANMTSASKYDVGEKAGETTILTSDNLTVVLPDDDESLYLDGKRVFIDRKNPKREVYKITRSDNVLYDYGEDHGGVLSFIADKTEFNEQTDRPDLEICDYEPPALTEDDKTPISRSSVTGIISGGKTLKVGFERTYKAEIYKDGELIEWSSDFSWAVTGDAFVTQLCEDEVIKIRVDDENMAGKTFRLHILHNDDILNTISVMVLEAV